MKINIEIDRAHVLATLRALSEAAVNLRPAMSHVGEYLILSTRQRFSAGRSPDGTPWAPNTETTLLRHLGRFKGSFNKEGRLSNKGAGRVAGKRPLIGETGALSSQIAKVVGDDYVEVGSTMEYANVHQLGAAKGAFGRTRRGAPIPWGDIPARPFIGLSSDDEVEVIAILREHLTRAIEG